MTDKLVPPFEGVDDGQTLNLLGETLSEQYPSLRSGILLAIADYYDLPHQTVNDVDNTVHRLEDIVSQGIHNTQDASI